VLTLLRLFTIAVLIVGPVVYGNWQQAQRRNFRVVREGILYRSGQTTEAGLRRLIHDYRIRTIVSLRDSSDPTRSAPDLAEEEFCRKNDIVFVRIPPRPWWSPTGPAPVERGVKQFLEVMSDPTNHPVLVHCFAGVHRTGAYCAIYRMEFEEWTNTEALNEMKACGYDNLDEEWDILGFLENYRPRLPRSHTAITSPRLAQ
jgi:tyrosine-protein phosphatase SIW14